MFFLIICWNNDVLDYAIQTGIDDVVQAIFDKRGIDFDSRGKGVFIWNKFIQHLFILHAKTMIKNL